VSRPLVSRLRENRSVRLTNNRSGLASARPKAKRSTSKQGEQARPRYPRRPEGEACRAFGQLRRGGSSIRVLSIRVLSNEEGTWLTAQRVKLSIFRNTPISL